MEAAEAAGPSRQQRAGPEGGGAVGALPGSLSQVDPSVLEELPPEVQKEVLSALTPGGLRRWRQRQRAGSGAQPSRLGRSSGAAAAATAQQLGQQAQQDQQGSAVREAEEVQLSQEKEPPEEGLGGPGVEVPTPLRQWLAGAAPGGRLSPALEAALEELEGNAAAASSASQPGAEEQEALCTALVRGCSALVACQLDELRAALGAVQRAGQRHGWFAGAAQRVVGRVQAAVEAEHGWRLRLGGWLE